VIEHWDEVRLRAFLYYAEGCRGTEDCEDMTLREVVTKIKTILADKPGRYEPSKIWQYIDRVEMEFAAEDAEEEFLTEV
jgi:hypothetical protein